jgi:GTP:adenosylcobinamide-phosphate guanylyltransferase
MTPLDVVVLAGGPTDSVARQQPGAPNKAFVEIAGLTLVGRVLIALRESPAIGKIVVVAPTSVREHADLAVADELRPDGRYITESLRSGLADLAPDHPVLVVASDLPVLTPEAVSDFAERAQRLDADVIYGCVEKRTHIARFPDVPHTWARFRDGTYCGGGIVAVKPRVLARLELFIEQLGAARKHPFRLASLFGWDVLARYAAGRLTIAQAETRGSKILGAPARALVSAYPETAVNVDRVSDIALADRLVRAARDAAQP